MLVRLVGGSLRSSRRCWGVQRWCPRTTSLRPKRPRTTSLWPRRPRATSLWPRRRSRTRRRRCRSRPTRRGGVGSGRGRRRASGRRRGGRRGAAAARGTLWVPSSAWPAGAPVGTPWPSPVVQLPADRWCRWGRRPARCGPPRAHRPDRGPTVYLAGASQPDGAPKLARAPHTHRACRIVATPFVIETETAAGAAPTEEDT